jgi:anti-sigma regulatory factor (Ser/Thr protein kinase)
MAEWASPSPGSTFVDDLLVVTSELVTNAVLHGRGAIELHVAMERNVAEVTVTDNGGGHPRLRPNEHGAEHGRGLILVDALVDDWGVRHSGPAGRADGSATAVWFRLRCT